MLEVEYHGYESIIEALSLKGWSIYKAAKETGIPENTISGWVAKIPERRRTPNSDLLLLFAKKSGVRFLFG